MYFGLTSEQLALQESVHDFLGAQSTTKDVRRLTESDSGYDEAVWRQMADQLGLQSLAIPEEYGGAGFTFMELAIVMEEAGYALLSAPLFASAVLAAQALQNSGDTDAMGKHLPGIATGTTIGTLALIEDSGSWDLGAVTTEAKADGGQFLLSGHKSYVIDGHVADLILVAATTPQGLSLFAVDGQAQGITRTDLPVLDQTRRMSRLEFDATPATLVGSAGTAAPGLRRTLHAAAVALAAEQIGGARRCLEMAVEYAKVRVQFNRPIGAFQAIKHICADMYTSVESGRAAVLNASWCVATGTADIPNVASLTKAYCSDGYYRVAADNIQVHGGIGFTWEHDCHLFFKRATSSAQYLGSADYHRELLAQGLDL